MVDQEPKSPLAPKLASLIPQWGIIVIMGERGEGKSALAYAIAESLQPRPVVSYLFPIQHRSLLPPYITPTYSMDFPNGSVVISDEAFLGFYSRRFMNQRNQTMEVLSSLARQKDLLLIYVTQSARKLDISLVEGAQLLLIKRPSLLQLRLDRGPLRGILHEAFLAFKNLKVPPGQDPDTWSKSSVYCISSTFQGMVSPSNSLPSFWSERLSKVFGEVPLDHLVEVDSLFSHEPSRSPVYCAVLECGRLARMICSCHGHSLCEEVHFEGTPDHFERFGPPEPWTPKFSWF